MWTFEVDGIRKIYDNESFDPRHNIFGLEIQHPPKADVRNHDPYVLYKSPNFDLAHYLEKNTINIMEHDRSRALFILNDMVPGPVKGTDYRILNLGIEGTHEFMKRYLDMDIDLVGIERCYDRFLKMPYHNIYYTKIIHIPSKYNTGVWV